MTVPADKRRVRRWYAELAAKLPADFTPLEAVATIKALDADGHVCLFTHKTSGLSGWEAYGMLAYALDDYSAATAATSATEDDE